MYVFLGGIIWLPFFPARGICWIRLCPILKVFAYCFLYLGRICDDGISCDHFVIFIFFLIPFENTIYHSMCIVFKVGVSTISVIFDSIGLFSVSFYVSTGPDCCFNVVNGFLYFSKG